MRNINNPRLNSVETNVDVSVGKKIENKSGLKELKRLKIEKDLKQKNRRSELTLGERLRNLEDEIKSRKEQILKLTKSIEETKIKLNEIKKRLGLPLTEEEPLSVLFKKDKLRKTKLEQEFLEKQKKELIQQEREKLIREEREKILQEKIKELKAKIEFRNSKRDIVNIWKSSSFVKKEVYGDGRRVEETFLETNPSKSVLISYKDGKVDKIIAGPKGRC